MTISADEVRQVYRALLGREPESEDVIAYQVAAVPDIETLIADVSRSSEYRAMRSPAAPLRGSVCKFADFGSDWFQRWSARLGAPGAIHRKNWEWAIKSQILFEHDMLRPGRRGLGFAVGQEPLPSLFASLGATIDATDIFLGDVSEMWTGSGEHADGLDALFKPDIVDRENFDRRVKFFPADMNALDPLPSDTYDFLWSSCAMEHLGTLDQGLAFVCNAMRLLKLGGVACHTTEFNVSSLEDTISEGWNVIYREKDIRRLAGDLRRQHCALEEMDFRPGWDREDILFDSQPWGQSGHLHIKLQIDDVICTSAVLVCRRYA